MPTPSIRVRLAVAMFAACLLFPGRIRADSDDLKRWPSGPVRYLTTKDEVRRFKELKTDRDRALFIERFWARRDPNPETLGNEYRQLFWQRVREANDLFLDSAYPGWKTDRGKIYILYGPPTEIQDYPNLAPESKPTSGRGVIRWIYQGRPGGRRDLDAVTVVPFVREVGGEYKLSTDPKLASVFFDELAIREGRYQRYAELLEAYPSELSVMLDLGKMQEVPPQEQVLMERVELIETYRTFSIRTQVDRSRDPETGAPLVSVTLHLPGIPPEMRPALMARFTSRDASDSPLILGEGSFLSRSDRAGGLVAQARTDLPPGTYDLLVVAAVPRGDETGLARRVVVVTEPASGLQLSDVIPLAELSPVEADALRSHAEPFYLGAFVAIPLAGRPLHPGDAVRLIYEIYGGNPPYRVTYRLEGKETDGSWVGLGRPAVLEAAQPAQGWELPTSPSWPFGDYRILVEVDDSEGAEANAILPFELEARSDGNGEAEAAASGSD